MLRFFESVDQFGVAFQPRISYSKNTQKTALGGVMSLAIYGISFCYLIYVFLQWQTGEKLPRVTNSQKIVKEQKFVYNETYLQLEARIFNFTKIDPFNPEALILQPQIFYFRNGNLTKIVPLNFPLQIYQGFHQINVSNLQLQISEIKSDARPDDELMISLGACQSVSLLVGQQCANQTLIDQYFLQPSNTLILRQFLKEFNPNTQELETIGRETMIPIQKNAALQQQTYVRMLMNQVDTGPLLESITEYEYITDYRTSNAVLNLEYFSSVIGFNVYVALYYKLDNIQAQQSITYPKLSEVLAEASSIASTLLLLSYLVIIVNQKQLEFEAINNIICMYFPDFKKVKIQKSIFGKVKQVEKDGKLLDVKSFEQKFQRLTQIAEKKLTISNQIYEISRLQFLLQSKFTAEQIRVYHEIGIPINFVMIEPSSNEDSNNNLKLEVNSSMNILFKTNKVSPNLEQKLDNDSSSALQLSESDFELLVL